MHSVLSRLGSNTDGQGQCGYGELPDGRYCRAKRRLGGNSAGLKRCENTASRPENAASGAPETFSFIDGGEDYKAPPLLAAGCSTRGNVLRNPPRPDHDSRTFPFLLLYCNSPFLSGTFTLVTTSITAPAGCIERGLTARVALGWGVWGVVGRGADRCIMGAIDRNRHPRGIRQNKTTPLQ